MSTAGDDGVGRDSGSDTKGNEDTCNRDGEITGESLLASADFVVSRRWHVRNFYFRAYGPRRPHFQTPMWQFPLMSLM
jgi:hypothetical protein